MITSEAKLGMRVEGGSGEDHDTGRIDAIDGEHITVAWDSGVVTTQRAAVLTPVGQAERGAAGLPTAE